MRYNNYIFNVINNEHHIMTIVQTSLNNPLLNWQQLPEFNAIQPQLLSSAIHQALKSAQNTVENIQNLNAADLNWDNLNEQLNMGMQELSYAWGVAHHISSVCDSQEWRDAIEAELEKVTDFWTKLGQNEILYQHTKKLHALAMQAKQNNDAIQLKNLGITDSRFKILEDSLLGFKLGGAELEGDAKQQYLDIQSEKALICKKISDNVLDANDRFAYIVQEKDIALLDGIPEHILHSLKQEDGTYKLTLHGSSYAPVMQYCKNASIREALYKAGITRASDITTYAQGELEWDNAPRILRLLELRQKIATLLNYNNYAEVSLATKMAQKPQKVLDFIQNLIQKAKPYAQKDIEQLKQFAQNNLQQNLELWDIPYVAELLRQKEYAYSEQDVQLYFTVPTVLNGLFNVIQKLFNVSIVEKSAQTWHEDMQFFAILNAEQQEIAYFYLDIYTRKSKQGGAWMNNVSSKRKYVANQNCLPVAYLICNFNKSAQADKASCITHNDVITLFHEFGHGLHHMLTQIEDTGASGIDGVEWDAVELPSQFMENFCWDYEVIQTLTKHIDTNEQLPRDLFDKMIAAKNFLSGVSIIRQVTFSMLDMQSHLHTHIDDIHVLAKQIYNECHVLEQLDISRWANTFTHVFAGGYAAGYYSYHWAEVLSSDVFAAFEEAKEHTHTILNADIGQQYLKHILSVGGSRPALDSFIAFRGREPNIDAFLRHNGL
jgi:oligopeptidase A